MFSRFRRLFAGEPRPIDEGAIAFALSDKRAAEKLEQLRGVARTDAELCYYAYIAFNVAAGWGIRSESDRLRMSDAYLTFWKAAARIEAVALQEQAGRVLGSRSHLTRGSSGRSLGACTGS